MIVYGLHVEPIGIEGYFSSLQLLWEYLLINNAFNYVINWNDFISVYDECVSIEKIYVR